MLESHATVQFQCSDPGVRCCGSNCTKHPSRQVAIDILPEIVNVGCLWPAAQTAYGNRLISFGVVKDYGRDTAKTGVLGQGNVEDDPGGDSRVCGIAPLFQNAIPRRCSQVMTR